MLRFFERTETYWTSINTQTEEDACMKTCKCFKFTAAGKVKKIDILYG